MSEEPTNLDSELAKHRRNLVVITVGLLIFEFAGGTIEKISIMGGGIHLSKGEVAVYVAYIALFYFLWRFWVYALPKHKSIIKDYSSALEATECYQRIVIPHVASFRAQSGIEFAEGYQKASIEEDENKEFIPVPVEKRVKKTIFRRSLVLSVLNPKGDYHPDSIEVKLGYWSFERCWIIAVADVVFNKKGFSDLVVPYLLALIAIATKSWKLWIA